MVVQVEDIAKLFPPVDTKWHTHVVKRFATPFVDVPFDRVDVDPIVLAHAATSLGYTIRDFYEVPEFGMRSVAYLNELYDLLPVTHWFYSNVWIDALGAKLECTDTLPWIVKERVIKEPEDVDRLEVPDVDEISKSMCAKLYFRALDYVKENIPMMFVPIHITFCLFSMAAELYDPTRIFIMMRREPEMVKKLVKKVADTSISGALAAARRYGFCLMVIGSVLANSNTMRPSDLKDFHLNYVRYFVRKAMKGGGGPQLWYHLCGDHSLDYKLWKEAPLSPFTVMHIGYHGDDVFPADLAKKEFGNKATILGSVDTKLMMDETNFLKVYEQAKKQILAGKDSPRGFIVGTSCETPVPTNPGNILAILKAAREYGTYE